jgi:hypothetical protein
MASSRPKVSNKQQQKMMMTKKRRMTMRRRRRMRVRVKRRRRMTKRRRKRRRRHLSHHHSKWPRHGSRLRQGRQQQLVVAGDCNLHLQWLYSGRLITPGMLANISPCCSRGIHAGSSSSCTSTLQGVTEFGKLDVGLHDLQTQT